ncbi:MAG: hypothetical protein JNM78_10490 [Cyclobacteriaceae bacterium]|nr:hypothetical protein [Cyclobacteriaceae bacterium]
MKVVIITVDNHLGKMQKHLASKKVSKISTEIVIDTLRSIRETSIDELLHNDDSLMAFLETHFNTLAISSVKKEFLKRDLNELRSSSLDLVHYSSLIKEIAESGSLVIRKERPLFHYELKVLFQKYGIEMPQ